MSSSALKAIEADRDALLTLCRGAGDSVWSQETGCPGWSVQDVISHMACSFWLAVDMSRLPDSAGLPAERAADVYVESRRSMTAAEVLADYQTASARGLELLAAVGSQDVEVPLGDVGTYSASVVPTAYAFEHYVHIRYDLFPPDGPFSGEPPASDASRLTPTLDWIEAALPQQNRALLDGLAGAVEVQLSGVDSRALTIGDGAPIGQIDCDAAAFVRWVTQRSCWESLGVKTHGDPTALEVVRKLHVF